MSLFLNLINGQQYIFTKNNSIKMTAEFIDIIGNTLRLNNYYYEDNIINNHMITMPTDWIIKIEKIDNQIITHNDIKIIFH